jgi:hypothetical protein
MSNVLKIPIVGSRHSGPSTAKATEVCDVEISHRKPEYVETQEA